MEKLILHGDLGPSLINYPTPAQDVILRALPWTIGLLGISAVLSWVIGIVVGAIAGWRRGKAGSAIITNLSIALAHVPFFFVALILVYVFAYTLGWLPARSAYDSNINPGISLDFIGSVLKYGLLPGLSIVGIGAMGWILSTRMLMVPVLGEDYLVYAEAKGLKPWRILTRYALRNCYLPQVTAFGISLGFIFNGNVLVEQLFNYPGLGTTLVTAIQQLDFNTILGVTDMAIFTVLTAVLLLDLLLPLLDPRVKYWK
nr:ABC transporter permease [Streptomyces sp. SID13031]